MSVVLKFTVPIPDYALGPNGNRKHWASLKALKDKAKKEATDAIFVGVYQMGDDWDKVPFPWRKAEMWVTWYKPREGRLDADNARTRLKYTQDMLSETGVLVDDDQIVYHPIEFKVDKDNPRVEISLKPV